MAATEETMVVDVARQMAAAEEAKEGVCLQLPLLQRGGVRECESAKAALHAPNIVAAQSSRTRAEAAEKGAPKTKHGFDLRHAELIRIIA